jgi:hypothetical protein
MITSPLPSGSTCNTSVCTSMLEEPTDVTTPRSRKSCTADRPSKMERPSWAAVTTEIGWSPTLACRRAQSAEKASSGRALLWVGSFTWEGDQIAAIFLGEGRHCGGRIGKQGLHLKKTLHPDHFLIDLF